MTNTSIITDPFVKQMSIKEQIISTRPVYIGEFLQEMESEKRNIPLVGFQVKNLPLGLSTTTVVPSKRAIGFEGSKFIKQNGFYNAPKINHDRSK